MLEQRLRERKKGRLSSVSTPIQRKLYSLDGKIATREESVIIVELIVNLKEWWFERHYDLYDITLGVPVPVPHPKPL